MERAAPPPLAALIERLGQLNPPPWMVQEIQQRLVLLANHVLQQEPQALERLARCKGHSLLVQWGQIRLPLVVTPAGLLDVGPDGPNPDLRVELDEASPLDMLKRVASGQRPSVRIEGDVQFAAEVGWLADHVRWDYEEDLARILGDAPAHRLAELLRGAAQTLRSMIAAPGRPGG